MGGGGRERCGRHKCYGVKHLEHNQREYESEVWIIFATRVGVVRGGIAAEDETVSK